VLLYPGAQKVNILRVELRVWALNASQLFHDHARGFIGELPRVSVTQIGKNGARVHFGEGLGTYSGVINSHPIHQSPGLIFAFSATRDICLGFRSCEYNT
jgi:hypothetical protein